LSFLIFTATQFFFALMAHSEAMMTDCAAMMVDVVTYLFNVLAERMKRGDPSMSARDLRLRRLYLELVPPFISVLTLIIVTVLALKEAFATLVSKKVDNNEADLGIMLAFSGLNLILDIFNVGCFARVDQAVGLPGQQTLQPHGHSRRPSERVIPTGAPTDECTPLLNRMESDGEYSQESEGATGMLNMNMCSAWTHILADTLRSVAVLVAAGFASIFPGILTPNDADSDAAIVVSIIILISLVPLLQGLYLTACKIYTMWKEDEVGHSIKCCLVV
jgi:Co/Zn/Cd efflux system component